MSNDQERFTVGSTQLTADELNCALDAAFAPQASVTPRAESVLQHLAPVLADTGLIALNAPPADSALERASTGTLGRFEVLGEIGRGGLGVVMRGRDVDLGRDVAMKVLHVQHAHDAGMVRKLVEEARVGGQLEHPGIVPVYEMGIDRDGRPFFAMKLVEGLTLAALLRQRQSPDQDRGRLLAIFVQVCQALGYAHARGVVHRDVKPSNVMVGAFGEVQVVDWGLAKILDHAAAAQPQSVIAGTPAYMAPELARGEDRLVDARSDVFGLGAILCEILTGRAVFEGTNRDEIRQAAAAGQLQGARVALAASGADAELVALSLRCLDPQRTGRPPDGGAVGKAVEDHLAAVEVRARAAELQLARAETRAAEERRRRRLVVALACSLLGSMLLAGAGYLWVAGEQRARTERADALVQQAIRIASYLQQQGDVSGAESVLREAIRLEPQRPGLYTEVGSLLLGARRYEDAEAVLRQGLECDRTQPALATLGGVLKELGRNDEARHVLEEALRLAPGDFVALNNMGPVLRAAGRLDEAEASLRQAIAARPDSALPHTNLGTVLEQRGDLDGAQREHEEATRLAPKLAAPWYNLGRIHDLRRDFPQAVPPIERAVALEPRNGLYQFYLGRTLYHVGDLEAAIAPLRASEPVSSDKQAQLLMLADCLQQTGDLQGALEFALQAMQTTPRNPDTAFDLGRLLTRLGRHEDAHSTFVQALELGDRTSEQALGQCRRLIRLHRKLPAVLAGQAEPESAADAVDLGRMALHQREASAAAALFERGLAEIAADGVPDVLFLAGVAATIAGFAGAEATVLPATVDGAAWRQKAIPLLRRALDAEVARVRSLSGYEHGYFWTGLSSWSRHPQLVALRDERRLAALDEATRQAVRSFWADHAVAVTATAKPWR